MADSNVQDQIDTPAPEPAAALPDYLASPDAVSGDEGVQWRFGKPPNYSNTRKVWTESKKANHEHGSLAEMVENLVKNWEVEASFKTRLQDWRTIDHDNYTFAMNGERPQTAEHMLRVGTYNAIIQPNEYYCPKNSDFASSHKTFKRMMPTFAWEVIEVYSGPPKVSFKWRHWGVMKNDFVGFNDKGEKVTAKAHGGSIEIFGVTVAQVDDKIRLQNVDTYMDPLSMFRQIAPGGIVNKEAVDRKSDTADELESRSEREAIMAEEPKIDYTENVIQAVGPGSQLAHAATETEIPATETASLGTCPFARQQQMNPDPPTRQQTDTPVDIANDTATVHSDSIGFSQPLEEKVSLPVTPVLPAGTIEPVTNVQTIEGAHAAGNEHDDMDLDTVSSKVEVDSVPSAESTMAVSQGMEAGSEERLPAMHHEVVPSVFADPGLGFDIYPSTAVNAQEMEHVTDVHPPMKKRRLDYAEDAPESALLLQEIVHPIPESIEEIPKRVNPDAGGAVAAPACSEETRKAHEEMGHVSAQESLELMNQE